MAAQRQMMPVILCGKSKETAQYVVDNLKPEYNVVKVILTIDQGKQDIPSLLQSKDRPQAVICGGGYNNDDVAALRKACEGSDAAVPWLIHSHEGQPAEGQTYREFVLYRAKKRLAEVELGKDGLWKY